MDDKTQNQAHSTAAATAKSSGGRQSVTFEALVATLEEFTELQQAAMRSPYDTAAMMVMALNRYAQNSAVAITMINHLKGPVPLTARELGFIKMQMFDYLARSYFAGATPQNDYTPSQPYTVDISDNPNSYIEQGCAKLYISCGGADSPRPVTMRLAKDGKWYLTEYSSLLLGCRKPESTNPWA